MKKILSQLSSFMGLTITIELPIILSIVLTLWSHGSIAVVLVNLVALGALVFWFRTLDQKVGRFLSTSRSTIAPLLDQGDKHRAGIFQQMDELEGSLNELKDRMNYMVDQMADKVLTDQEVQSAELFQSLFFPKEKFKSETFTLDGRYLPANQCSGDWWQFFRSGDELLVLIGDVTGHGVAAALVTAAVQAAYSVVVSQIQAQSEKTGRIPSLNSIFSYLNEAVLAVGGTEATMTLFGSIINLKTGVLTTLNASHQPAYIFRGQTSNETKAAPYELHKTLRGGLTGSLGESFDPSISPQAIQLCPGDFIFWYTDGFVECTNSAGKVISRKNILDTLRGKMAGPDKTVSQLSDMALQEFFSFVGGRLTERKDDVIVIFGAVPTSAVFEQARVTDAPAALMPGS